MRLLMAALILMSSGACVAAEQASDSSFALLMDDRGTWCAFESRTGLDADAETLIPTDSAKITYRAGELVEVLYQTLAESGDWSVVDIYTPSDGDVRLRRITRMLSENLVIVQKSIIRGREASDFRIVSVRTLKGKKVKLAKGWLPEDIRAPEVEIFTDPLQQPFVHVVAELRKRSLKRLCK